MELSDAANALGALGQECRLQVFRLLVQRGSTGMVAGDIANELGVAPSTLSAHLTILSRAGLIASRKEGRSVIYAIDLEGTAPTPCLSGRRLLSGRTEGLSPANRVSARTLLLGGSDVPINSRSTCCSSALETPPAP
jgi:ArsR family transcriptional regulator